MSAKLNIVHSVESLATDKGGPTYSICKLAAAQARIVDDPVHMLSRSAPHQLAAAIPGTQLHSVARRWPQHMLESRALLRGLWRDRQTVLHDHGLWLMHNLACAGFAARRNLPYVVSPHGMLEPWALAYRAVRKRVARALYQDRLLRNASCLVATARKEHDSIRKLGFTNPIAIIPNGVDGDIPILTRKAPVTPRIALFLSRLHPVKGLIHLIEAWHALRPQGWRLKIVGPSEGGHREDLMTLVKRYRLDELVTFHEAVSGAAKYQQYYDADVFLLPSYSENFGVVVAEAFACKVPVVTTVGTPWSEIPSKGCGWCIDTGTQPLIDALPDVLKTTQQDLQAMGERGHRWITGEFQWPTIAAQSIAVYEWVLGRGSKPDCVYM